VKLEIGKEHPAAADLVQSHAAGIDRMRAFIVQHNLLALPPKDSLTVTVTPLFKRGVTAAEYLAPNMLDRGAAYRGTYYVDPIDPTWPKDKVASTLRAHNTAGQRAHRHPRGVPGPPHPGLVRQAALESLAHRPVERAHGGGLGGLRRGADGRPGLGGPRTTATASSP